MTKRAEEMTAEIAHLSQLNVERQQLIVRHDKLTADHADLTKVRNGLDVHVFELDA